MLPCAHDERQRLPHAAKPAARPLADQLRAVGSAEGSRKREEQRTKRPPTMSRSTAAAPQHKQPAAVRAGPKEAGSHEHRLTGAAASPLGGDAHAGLRPGTAKNIKRRSASAASRSRREIVGEYMRPAAEAVMRELVTHLLVEKPADVTKEMLSYLRGVRDPDDAPDSDGLAAEGVQRR